MSMQRCRSAKPHGPHEWYWKNILRRECPGLVVTTCGFDKTHGPHWVGEYHDELCYGLGLAAICEHGEQMLNECRACEAKS